MSKCTVSIFNIILKRLAPCLFSSNRRDLGVFRGLARLFVKWSTITAAAFGVLQHAVMSFLSVLLRLLARGLHT